MKRFTSLMIASSLLLPGLATAKSLPTLRTFEGQDAAKSLQAFRTFEGQGAAKSLSVQKMNRERTSLRQTINNLAKAPARETEAPDLDPIITEAPEGKVTKYARSGLAYYSFWGVIPMETTYEAVTTEIVECENGDVYFKDPISQFPTNSYLKGKKVGDTYEFELPQAIYSEELEGETYTYMLTNMQYYEENPEEGGWFFAVNTDEYRDLGFEDIDNKLVMTVVDGVITYEALDLDAEDPEDPMIIGMVDTSYAWTNYGEVLSYMTEFNDKLVEVPAGLATEEYLVRDENNGNFCEVGFDGDDVYVKGLFNDVPDAWIKGTRDGNKITFENGQYLGENKAYGYYTYFVTAKYAPVFNEDYGQYVDNWEINEAAVFSFDEKEKAMTTDEDQCVFYNAGKNSLAYITSFTSPVIKKQPNYANTNPANPYDLSFTTGDYIYLDFYVTPFNVDGYLMDTDQLYYKIFIDGEEYTFYPDEYVYLEEEMTLIPYNFTDSWDIYILGNMREVSFYSEGFEEVGVQLYNYKYDVMCDDYALIGQSDLVTISTSGDDPTLGVEVIGDTEGKTVAGVKYFNMAGQEVSNPSDGMFVKTVKYVDGSVKSFKVIKK